MIGSYLRNRGGRAALGALFLVLVPAGGLAAQDDVSHRQCSPDGRLCFALTTVDGAPTFDGHPPGWTVYPPGSWHVPTVAGGVMDILYFLPGGAIRFEPQPA